MTGDNTMQKLQVGMIGGGGPGSFFGGVHRRAISLDGTRELVAGALRSDPEASLEAAAEWGIEGFPTWERLLKAWIDGDLPLAYVTIVTPNNAHFEPAKACLEAGLPVLCEKPMTLDVKEAETLAALVKQKNVPFVLAHTYTGHPQMMYARELVKSGAIGDVRKVEAWYRQGWLATELESTGQQQASWRVDPKQTGISNCGGDIGVHAMMTATFVTGLKIKRVSARLNSFVTGRLLDDDFNTFAELENGGTAVITATQIAVGYKNENGFRVFGTKGSIEWDQENAERLQVRRGQHDEVYWLGANQEFFPDSVRGYQRLPAGHHEDFLEALANLHTTMERHIRLRRGEDVPKPYDHPGVEDGVAGMRFIKAAVDSSKNDGAWTDV
jgi:predicted dehydrogenase